MGFLFGWIPDLGKIVVNALQQAIKAVLLIVLVAAVIGWGKAHPEQAQALVTNVMTTLAELIPKLLNAFVTLLTRFLDWLSGL